MKIQKIKYKLQTADNLLILKESPLPSLWDTFPVGGRLRILIFRFSLAPIGGKGLRVRGIKI